MLPIATEDDYGSVKVKQGNGLVINGGVLSFVGPGSAPRFSTYYAGSFGNVYDGIIDGKLVPLEQWPVLDPGVFQPGASQSGCVKLQTAPTVGAVDFPVWLNGGPIGQIHFDVGAATGSITFDQNSGNQPSQAWEIKPGDVLSVGLPHPKVDANEKAGGLVVIIVASPAS